MSKVTPIALAAIFLLSSLTLCFAQESVDLSGEWQLITKTPRGEMTSTAKFVKEGEKITVTMTAARGSSTGTGTIKGAVIQWTITRETSRGKSTIAYKGKVEGNTMKGQAQIGGQGTMEWKATRKVG